MDIMIYCNTEYGESIGFGLSDIETIKDFHASVYDLLPCLSESYYENYRDFEADILRAAKEGISKLEYSENSTRSDFEKSSRAAIDKVFGKITASYEVDGRIVNEDLGVDKGIFTESFYELLVDEVVNEMDRIWRT